MLVQIPNSQIERREKPRLLYAQHFEECGKKFFAEMCRRDLEGIVAKRKMSINKDDGQIWIKVKNKNYSQSEGWHELLTQHP